MKFCASNASTGESHFFRHGSKIIIPLSVRETLDETIASKLAYNVAI
jgi:hypothetical protein